jgi:hypothetical protein
VSIKGLREETTLSSSEVDFRVLHLPNRKASVRTWPGAGADLSHGRIPGGSKSQKERVPDVVVQRKKSHNGERQRQYPKPKTDARSTASRFPVFLASVVSPISAEDGFRCNPTLPQ